MTTGTLDPAAVQAACAMASIAASTATQSHLTVHGDRDACGFAWVSVHGVRSNSKTGKILIANGFDRAYGGGLQLWNPSGNATQCITAKEAGSVAYAKVLKEQLGLSAFANSRLD